MVLCTKGPKSTPLLPSNFNPLPAVIFDRSISELPQEIFILPCWHLLLRLIRIELVGLYPNHCKLSALVFPTIRHFLLLCEPCSIKSALPSSTVRIVMLRRKPFNEIREYVHKCSKDVLRGIQTNFGDVYIFCPVPFNAFELHNAGYYVVVRLLYKHIILQEAMSWLSTLGGGFSCLGDKFEDAAEIAGAISLRQMRLANFMQVPFFQARCRLFFAQSMMQRGKLKLSADIIRSVYKFSKEAPFYDNPPELHLDLMCRGLWTRLVYLWNLKRDERMKRQLNLTDADREVFLKDSSSTGPSYSESSARRLFPDVSKILNAL